MNGCLMIGYGAIGGFVGLMLGALVGVILGIVTGVRARGTGPGGRIALGFGAVSLATTLGLALGVVAGVVVAYYHSVKDGPPHGYPDRAAYRAAEMEARAKRFEPVLTALEKFKTEHNRYPAKLQELIDGKYLDALPPEKLSNDHLGHPGRVAGNETWYWYAAPAAGTEFALRLGCVFTEDLRNAAPLRVNQLYRSSNPGWNEWKPGSWPPWPPAPELQREVAPPPRELTR